VDFFLFSRWFCHFDDDNYVNVPRLVKLLDEYSPSVDWYLGKPSISSPLEIHLDSVSANASYFCIFSYIVRNYKPACDRLSPSTIGPAQKPEPWPLFMWPPWPFVYAAIWLPAASASYH